MDRSGLRRAPHARRVRHDGAQIVLVEQFVGALKRLPHSSNICLRSCRTALHRRNSPVAPKWPGHSGRQCLDHFAFRINRPRHRPAQTVLSRVALLGAFFFLFFAAAAEAAAAPTPRELGMIERCAAPQLSTSTPHCTPEATWPSTCPASPQRRERSGATWKQDATAYKRATVCCGCGVVVWCNTRW